MRLFPLRRVDRSRVLPDLRQNQALRPALPAGRGHRIAVPCLMALALAAASCGEDPATAPSPPGSDPAAAYREAARVTSAGLLASMRDAQAGESERAVKGIIDQAFAREGGDSLAFPHIVAAGAHAGELHYFGDDGVLQDGELLLVDIGAKSEGICSDATRTFPVGPAFAPRQEELYGAVLDVYRQVTASVRPGIDSLRDLDARARTLFRESPLRARTPEGIERTLDAFFVHYLGHYVGRSVHGEDTGWNPALPFQPGQVVAIEPGLYIASEGIGIRVEDTFLVTAEGLECLTCACPKTIAEVESLRSAPVPALAVR